MNYKYIPLILVLGMMLGGCIWIDDDDDNDGWHDYVEEIIYINRTDVRVENFIDGRYVGTCDPYSTIHVFDSDWDGYHDFYSHAVDDSLEWGPTEFYIRQGETFRVYLEPGAYGHGGRQSFRAEHLD